MFLFYFIVLKHKIICLQIYRKLANCHTCFSKKQSYIQLLHWNMSSVSEYLFLFWSVIPPTANLPSSILTPRVATWRKTQHIAAMEASKWTGSEIVNSIRPKINLQCKICHLPLSIVLIPLMCPQSDNPCECRVWGGGGGRNNRFNFDCSTHFIH